MIKEALNNFILVEMIDSTHDDISSGGIIMSSRKVEDPIGLGKVVSIGNDVNLPIKVGDKICFPKQILKVDSEGKYGLVQSHQVYGTCE